MVTFTNLPHSCGPQLFICLIHFLEVWKHLFLDGYVKVPPQHFDQVEIWTSTSKQDKCVLDRQG